MAKAQHENPTLKLAPESSTGDTEYLVLNQIGEINLETCGRYSLKIGLRGRLHSSKLQRPREIEETDTMSKDLKPTQQRIKELSQYEH